MSEFRAELALIPGSPETCALVRGLDTEDGPRVLLEVEAWPMTPERARMLSALLAIAALKAEAAAEFHHS